MNLKEHIRKVLKENHTDKMIKLIDNYMKTFYPYFKYEISHHSFYQTRSGHFVVYYSDPRNDFDFATYREYEKELQLNREIFDSLEGLFGDNMDYVVDWFNYKFGEDAEYVTF